MPELPEVETIRRDLTKTILNKPIANFKVFTKTQFKGNIDPESYFINKKITSIDRIGKLLIFNISEPNRYLLCHLRMTGQLVCVDKNKKTESENNLPNKHTHIDIKFNNGTTLYFNDIRKFGYMQAVNKDELKKVKAKFGIEPLTKKFTLANFLKLIGNKKISIKNFLLNQQIVAGIGNIYADEICFHSRVRPQKKVDQLTAKELKLIFKSCQNVIEQAITERGTSFSDYRDGRGEKGNYLKYLQVYGRKGEKCYQCQSQIKKCKVAGRGTHYCQTCQK